MQTEQLCMVRLYKGTPVVTARCLLGFLPSRVEFLHTYLQRDAGGCVRASLCMHGQAGSGQPRFKPTRRHTPKHTRRAANTTQTKDFALSARTRVLLCAEGVPGDSLVSKTPNHNVAKPPAQTHKHTGLTCCSGVSSQLPSRAQRKRRSQTETKIHVCLQKPAASLFTCKKTLCLFCLENKPSDLVCLFGGS